MMVGHAFESPSLSQVLCHAFFAPTSGQASSVSTFISCGTTRFASTGESSAPTSGRNWGADSIGIAGLLEISPRARNRDWKDADEYLDARFWGDFRKRGPNVGHSR